MSKYSWICLAACLSLQVPVALGSDEMALIQQHVRLHEERPEEADAEQLSPAAQTLQTEAAAQELSTVKGANKILLLLNETSWNAALLTKMGQIFANETMMFRAAEFARTISNQSKFLKETVLNEATFSSTLERLNEEFDTQNKTQVLGNLKFIFGTMAADWSSRISNLADWVEVLRVTLPESTQSTFSPAYGLIRDLVSSMYRAKPFLQLLNSTTDQSACKPLKKLSHYRSETMNTTIDELHDMIKRADSVYMLVYPGSRSGPNYEKSLATCKSYMQAWIDFLGTHDDYMSVLMNTADFAYNRLEC